MSRNRESETWWGALLHRFRRHSRGGIATTYALMLIPVLIAVGGAVDFGAAVSARSALNDAADAAALAAAKQAQQQLAAGASNWSTQGIATGKSFFSAQASKLANTTVTTPTVTVTQSGATITTTISYTANVATVLLPLVGIPTVNVHNTVTVKTAAPVYANLYIVIDNSESMGIGATAADQQTMYNSISCAFACHFTTSNQTDNVAQARASGATLRIDVVKQAVVAALNQVSSLNLPGQIKVAVYTVSDGLTTVYPLSTNLSAAVTAVNGLDVAGANFSGGTDISYGLQSLNGALAASGNGTSATSPLGIVILATDAVQNNWDLYYANGSSAPFTAELDPNFSFITPHQDFPAEISDLSLQGIDPSQCSPIKQKGYTLMTLDIQYLVPTTGVAADKQQMFDYINQTLVPSIQSNMAACATSSSSAYSASSPAEITAAFSAIFSAATAKLRIAQ